MKQTLEIKRFLSGIISAPAEADIPVDAASYSLNVDPTTEDGKLGGVPDDLTKKTGVNATALALLEGETTWTALYTEAAEIKGVSDFYGTPGTASFTGTATISPGITNPVIQVWNKAAHIGLGPDEADPPKFVGYIDKGQLDNPAPTGLQIEDAEIAAPAGYSGLYKIIRLAAGTIGIGWQDHYLYTISSTGVITRRQKLFGATQGMCLDYADTDKLWVYDNDGNTAYGTLFKIDISEVFAGSDVEDYIILTAKIEDWGGGALTNAGDTVSDIHNSSGKLWYAVWGDAAFTTSSKMLLNSDKPTTTGSLVTTTDRSPTFSTSVGDAGKWTVASGGPAYTTRRQSLFTPQGAGAYVGWSVDLGNGVYTINVAAGVPYAFESSVVIVAETYTAGAIFDTNCAPRQLMTITPAKITTTIVGIYESDQSDANDGLFATTTVSGDDYITVYSFDHANTVGGGAISAGGGTTSVKVTELTHSIPSVGDGITSAAVTALEDAPDYDYTIVESDNGYRHKNGTYETTTPTFGTAGNDVSADLFITLENTTTELPAGEGFFTTKRYFYKVSYVYDGSQESPLSIISGSIVPTTADRAIRVTLTLFNTTGFSKRITSVNIYRAESQDTTGGAPDTFYRLVSTLSLDYLNFRELPDLSGVVMSADHLDTYITGVTYEANSGLPESLERSIVHYGLAYVMNSEMIVGQCWVPDVPDSERMLFKSLPGQLDSFNTIDTFVLLKAKPTAVCGYNGRFYGFDTGRIYRVNPNPFVIEDVFEGVGCAWATAVVSTEYGMFHADENGIYRHNGQSPEMLSYPVRDLWALKVTSTYTPKLMFDSVRRCLLVFHAIAGPAYRVLAYSLVHQGWWYWETVLPKALLRGKDGEVYVSNGTDLIEYLGGTGFRAYDWYSKGLTAGNDSIKKRWFSTRVQAEGTGGTWTGTLTFLADGSAVTPTTDHDGETFRFIHKAWAEKFQIKLDNMPGNDLIDSFGINIRQKVVAG